jgi:hypothetical protein
MIVNAVVNLRKQVVEDSSPSQKEMLVSSVLVDEIAEKIRPFINFEEVVADDEYSKKFKTKIELEFL